jgi:hypothetical protein
VERFIITDAKTIDYEVTIQDPKLFHGAVESGWLLQQGAEGDGIV